jgi:hypothetical protein
MIQRLANPVNSENSPRPITTTPDVLKNTTENRDCEKPVAPNERSASMGKVPRENAPIISNHSKNDQLDNAANCID